MEFEAFLHSQLLYEQSCQGIEVDRDLDCAPIAAATNLAKHSKSTVCVAMAAGITAVGVGITSPQAFAYVPEIAELQTLLASRGFDPGPIDGEIGASTRTAIADAQTYYEVTIDGIVGAETLAALQDDDYVAPGFNGSENGDIDLSGDDIIFMTISNTEIQSLLAERGFYSGDIDGLIGEGTRQAILDAQESYSVAQDGLFGECTFDALRLEFAENACLI